MANEKALGNLTMENVRIGFRNFEGKEGPYNREGDRNFVVFLDNDLAIAMQEDGWNIKRLKKRDDDDPDEAPQAYVQVSVSYKIRPPVVVLIGSRGRTNLPEELVNILDFTEMANVDLIINPYQWAVNGKTGIKAYLRSIYVTVQEDELAQKYADVPELETRPKQLQIESGGRLPQDPDEIIIEDDDAPWN